jgi:hypothetical protein
LRTMLRGTALSLVISGMVFYYCYKNDIPDPYLVAVIVWCSLLFVAWAIAEAASDLFFGLAEISGMIASLSGSVREWMKAHNDNERARRRPG